MAETNANIWSSGEAYEAYVGRWSRLVAREFVEWLSPVPNSVWLDVGCGTGALSHMILEMTRPRRVFGVDHSKPFVDYVHAELVARGFAGSVHDARNLGLKQESCNFAISGLALNFIPNPEQAVREMARVVKTGGFVAAYVWDYNEIPLMQHFWNAASQLDPDARMLDESNRFRMWKPDYMIAVFQNAQLNHVQARVIDVLTVFRDFHDFWMPFLGGQGPAPAYAAALSEERRSALRERVRTNLPVASDGSIHLKARACAVRGTR